MLKSSRLLANHKQILGLEADNWNCLQSTLSAVCGNAKLIETMSSLTVEIAKNNRLKKAPLAKKHSSFNTWFKVETHSDTLELSDVHPVQWDPGSEVLFWFLLIGSGSLQQGGDWNRLGTWISYRVLWRFLSHMCKHNSSGFQSTQIMITLCKNVQIEMFYLSQVFWTPGGQNKI